MISYSAVSPARTLSTISSSVQPSDRAFSRISTVSIALATIERGRRKRVTDYFPRPPAQNECNQSPVQHSLPTEGEMKELDDRLNIAWWALRIGLGLGPIIAGCDKYFNILTDWSMYLSPLATKVVPVSASTFMHMVGVVEIIAGLVVLSRWTKVGSYVVMAWLLGI